MCDSLLHRLLFISGGVAALLNIIENFLIRQHPYCFQYKENGWTGQLSIFKLCKKKHFIDSLLLQGCPEVRNCFDRLQSLINRYHLSFMNDFHRLLVYTSIKCGFEIRR